MDIHLLKCINNDYYLPQFFCFVLSNVCLIGRPLSCNVDAVLIDLSFVSMLHEHVLRLLYLMWVTQCAQFVQYYFHELLMPMSNSELRRGFSIEIISKIAFNLGYRNLVVINQETDFD